MSRQKIVVDTKAKETRTTAGKVSVSGSKMLMDIDGHFKDLNLLHVNQR